MGWWKTASFKIPQELLTPPPTPALCFLSSFLSGLFLGNRLTPSKRFSFCRRNEVITVRINPLRYGTKLDHNQFPITWPFWFQRSKTSNSPPWTRPSGWQLELPGTSHSQFQETNPMATKKSRKMDPWDRLGLEWTWVQTLFKRLKSDGFAKETHEVSSGLISVYTFFSSSSCLKLRRKTNTIGTGSYSY